jgi:hypothetical protein
MESHYLFYLFYLYIVSTVKKTKRRINSPHSKARFARDPAKAYVNQRSRR